MEKIKCLSLTCQIGSEKTSIWSSQGSLSASKIERQTHAIMSIFRYEAANLNDKHVKLSTR